MYDWGWGGGGKKHNYLDPLAKTSTKYVEKEGCGMVSCVKQ